MKSLMWTLLVFILASSCVQSQNKFDHSKWNALLKKYVDENGLVDYKGIESEESFTEYIDLIAEADVGNFSRNGRLAFYINAYNACVVKNVLDNWPVESPLKVDGFFKKIKFTVAGENLTLDEIEHKKTLQIDPVFPHFGLVCAAVSCPKLIPFAYDADNVNEQLRKNAKDFLSDENKNYLDKESNTLYLSQIFKWFESYFINEYDSVLEFAAKYLPENDAKFVIDNKVDVEYLEYNWELNKQ